MSELRDQQLNLANLPIEVLIDNVLPFLPASDLSRLAQCNKLFSILCADETLWKHKVLEDFNFSGQGTARTSGWRFIYRGLFKPRVFVWGEKANGRLGLAHPPKSVVSGIPYPIQLGFQGVRIVSLVAGGMSFHALDSEGKVHVWGTLNGTFSHFAAEVHGFSSPGQQARTPHTLALPSPIRSISCGRLHSSCLDRANKVWTFTNWGRPFRLSASILDDPDYTPKQIECGWGFSSMLTRSGEVFVWWPFDGAMGETIQQKMRDMDSEGERRALPSKDGLIPCVTWDLDMMPIRLPALPDLPQLSGTEVTSRNIELIQIAAFDQHIVGLTNRGHVLKYGGLQDETAGPNGRWEYLPLFSEVERIREHSAFSSKDNSTKLDAPQTLQITHISANFLHFVAYSTDSSSIVLIGDTNTTPTTEPKIIPELQHKSVISVVVGDYHNAALTAAGKLLTWGEYSNGALGLGDPLKLEPGTPGAFASARDLAAVQNRDRLQGRPLPPAVNIPTEVRFDHNSKKPRERFCFSVTAAGWHTGALVIDLQQEDDEDDELVENAPSDSPEPSTSPARSRWQTPPILPIPGIYRIGHPGRGGFYDGLPPPS